jgi:hypothetical protein
MFSIVSLTSEVISETTEWTFEPPEGKRFVSVCWDWSPNGEPTFDRMKTFHSISSGENWYFKAVHDGSTDANNIVLVVVLAVVVDATEWEETA